MANDTLIDDARQFAVNGSKQAAICSEPAGLDLDAIAVDPSQDAGTALEAFEISDFCKGRRLSGGECATEDAGGTMDGSESRIRRGPERWHAPRPANLDSRTLTSGVPFVARLIATFVSLVAKPS